MNFIEKILHKWHFSFSNWQQKSSDGNAFNMREGEKLGSLKKKKKLKLMKRAVRKLTKEKLSKSQLFFREKWKSHSMLSVQRHFSPFSHTCVYKFLLFNHGMNVFRIIHLWFSFKCFHRCHSFPPFPPFSVFFFVEEFEIIKWTS